MYPLYDRKCSYLALPSCDTFSNNATFPMAGSSAANLYHLPIVCAPNSDACYQLMSIALCHTLDFESIWHSASKLVHKELFNGPSPLSLCGFLPGDLPVVYSPPPTADSTPQSLSLKFGSVVPVSPSTGQQGPTNALDQWHENLISYRYECNSPVCVRIFYGVEVGLFETQIGHRG